MTARAHSAPVARIGAPARLWLGLLPVLLAVGVWAARHGWTRPAFVYVWAGQQALQGTFGPHVYDDEATIAATGAASGGQSPDVVSPSPPTIALFFLPFAALDPAAQGVMWNALSAGALALAAAVAWRALTRLRRRGWLAAAVASALACAYVLSAPMALNVRRGQVYVWLLAGLALVMWAARREAPMRGALAWLGAGGLAAVFVLKFAGWPVWLALAVRRQWTLLGRAALLAAGAVVASLPFVGVDTWQHYFTVLVPERMRSPVLTLSAYQTVGSFWQHLLRYDAEWNPAPVAHAPLLAAVLAGLTVAGLVGLTLLLAARGPLRVTVAAALALTVPLAPAAEQYAYITTLPALAVALDAWAARPSALAGLALLAAAGMLLWPLPYQSPNVQAGWLALLAFPRLYGGLLLWAVLWAQGLAGRPLRGADSP